MSSVNLYQPNVTPMSHSV